MKLSIIYLLYLLTEIVIGTTGPDCHHFIPFEVKRTDDGMPVETIVQTTLATITTKSCHDHQQCSRLRVTDTENKTYIALDCLDRKFCQNPESWCQTFTGSLFKACEIMCCDGELCAEMNKTKAVVTENTNSHKVTCSTFTPFQVDVQRKKVEKVYSPPETKNCELNEICGGIILSDRNNAVHQASACVNHNHCKDPVTFCTKLTEASNGTFIDCQLKCCNGSFCLEGKKSDETSPRCFEYDSFAVAGDEVEFSSGSSKIKTCKEDELCSRGTFTDRKNNTHVSLDCVKKSLCNNPEILCQYFSEGNQRSPFVGCNIECCTDNLCYSDSLPASSQTPASTTPTVPTIVTPSGTEKVQSHIGRILEILILLQICNYALHH